MVLGAIACTVAVGYRAEHPTWIAYGHDTCGYAVGNHATSAYDTVVANGNTGQQDRVAPYPHPPTYVYGLRHQAASGAFLGIEHMVARVDAYMRANEGVVANGDLAAVENGAIEVDVDIAADSDVLAKLTTEVGLYLHAVAHGAEELTEDGLALVYLVIVGVVKGAEEALSHHPAVKKVGIEVVVNHAGLHLFPFSHNRYYYIW